MATTHAVVVIYIVLEGKISLAHVKGISVIITERGTISIKNLKDSLRFRDIKILWSKH